MKKLAFTNPEYNIPTKVALIGSSKCILNSNLGSLIDTYDLIVRFNRAPIKGYEKDVGSRTDLRVVNNHVFNNAPITSKWNKDINKTQPPNFVKNMRSSDIYYIGPSPGTWKNRDKNIHKSVNAFKFDYKQMSKLKSVFKFGSSKNLSVGTTFVCLCIKSNIVPSLFAFDLHNRPRDHYWENRDKSGPFHDIDVEKKLLKKLLDDKKIEVY